MLKEISSQIPGLLFILYLSILSFLLFAIPVRLPSWAGKILCFVSILVLGPVALIFWWRYVKDAFPFLKSAAERAEEAEQLPELPKLSINTVAVEDARQVAVSKILKNAPHWKSLADVTEQMGLPTRVIRFPSGYVLAYPNGNATLSHAVLIEMPGQKVKFVAVANAGNDALTMAMAEERWGKAQLQAVIEKNGYWLFENAPAAVISKSKNNQTVLYLQLFPKALSLEDYYQWNAYHKETFAVNQASLPRKK